MTTEPMPSRLWLDWTLGDRLRKVRRAVGVSQEQFAATLEVNKKSLAAWELDTNEPRNIVALAKRIELAYGVPASWTLGLKDEYPGPTGPGPDGRPRQDSNLQPTGYRGESLAEIVTLRPSPIRLAS